MCPAKKDFSPHEVKPNPALVETSLESVYRHAARLRQEMLQLSEHAKELANYISNQAQNASLLLDESIKLRLHAEELLRKPSAPVSLLRPEMSPGKPRKGAPRNENRSRPLLVEPQGDVDRALENLKKRISEDSADESAPCKTEDNS